MGVPAGPWYIDDLLTFTVVTHRFDTGVLTDADAVPPYRIYEDETGTAILTGNTAKLDDASTTGFYSEQITLSAANGFEVGKSYAIYVTATVNAIQGGQTFNFKVIAADPSSATIAAAVWDLDATAHQTQGTFGQAIGDPAADTHTIDAATVTDATGVTVGTDTATLLTRMGTPADLGGGATLAGNLSDIEGQTDDIGVAGAGLTNINLPNQTMDIIGNITGNLSGSVGSVTGAVGSVTGAVGSVTGLTAADVGAIKVTTDKFVFTIANNVNANIQYVNDVLVNGNGSPGTEWGP